MVTEREALAALNETADPEIGIGIVDLGLVAHISVVDDYIHVRLRMTTPRCPFQPFIVLEAHRRLLDVSGISGVEIETEQDSRWRPEMMSEHAKTRLGYVPPRVRHDPELVPEMKAGGSKIVR